jgi:hypothetical protein
MKASGSALTSYLNIRHLPCGTYWADLFEAMESQAREELMV